MTLIKPLLFEEQKALGARFIDFGGYYLPAFYSKSVIEEHKHTRNYAGIFDVSHMGEIFVEGNQAQDFLDYMTTNNVSSLKDNQGHYTTLCKEDGGMVDDLILYRLNAKKFLLCVNGANIEKDFAWIKSHEKTFQVTLTNESSLWSQFAVQGPKSPLALLEAFPELKETLEKLKYMEIASVVLEGEPSYLARTGYTGEHGYELYCSHEVSKIIWQKLLEKNKTSNLLPIGLGARDTLRLESCYLLYGSDMNESISPLEVGVGWVVKEKTHPYLGSEVFQDQRKNKTRRKLFGFFMEDQGIPRHDMPVYRDDQLVGKVTSGSFLPTVGKSGGLALLEGNFKEGDLIFIDIRGNRKQAQIVKRPFYQAKIHA